MFVDMKKDRATWQSTVRKMVSRGADGTDQELDAIVNYLATYLGKDDDQKPDKINVNKGERPRDRERTATHHAGGGSDRPIPDEERRL
jgi:hypothetical protein